MSELLDYVRSLSVDTEEYKDYVDFTIHVCLSPVMHDLTLDEENLDDALLEQCTVRLDALTAMA